MNRDFAVMLLSVPAIEAHWTLPVGAYGRSCGPT